MPISEWVRAARKHAKMTLKELGEQLSRSKANVGHWETGQHEPSYEQMRRISEVTGYPLPHEQAAIEVLEGRNEYAEEVETRGHALDTMSPLHDHASEGRIRVALLNVQGSMGYGVALSEREDVVTRMEVDESWLRRMATFTSVENLALITGKGDSMRPTFEDGDPLLVDRGVKEIKVDSVYVLAMNDDLYIKRLQRRPDGSLLMLSDNPQYQPYHITNGEKDKVEVLGRVLLAWNAKRI